MKKVEFVIYKRNIVSKTVANFTFLDCYKIYNKISSSIVQHFVNKPNSQILGLYVRDLFRCWFSSTNSDSVAIEVAIAADAKLSPEWPLWLWLVPFSLSFFDEERRTRRFSFDEVLLTNVFGSCPDVGDCCCFALVSNDCICCIVSKEEHQTISNDTSNSKKQAYRYLGWGTIQIEFSCVAFVVHEQLEGKWATLYFQHICLRTSVRPNWAILRRTVHILQAEMPAKSLQM